MVLKFATLISIIVSGPWNWYNLQQRQMIVLASWQVEVFLHISLSISIGPAIVSLYSFTANCKKIRTIGHRKRHKSLEKRVEVCNIAAV